MVTQKVGICLGLAGALSGWIVSAAADEAAKHEGGLTTAKIAAPAEAPGGIGWQRIYEAAVPKGENLIFSYSCPDDAKVPVSNSFSPNTPAKNGLQLIASFRPKAKPQAWQWEIHWPSGAPTNSHIFFNIYCNTQ